MIASGDMDINASLGSRADAAMPTEGSGTACSAGGADICSAVHTIRGRGDALGSRDVVRQLEPAISGPAVGPGPRWGDAQCRAQARLDAKNHHLLRSFEDHADRVRKRRASALDAAPGPSAVERLAALRRRVAARSAGHRMVDEAGTSPLKGCEQGREGVGAQAAEGFSISLIAGADDLENISAPSIEDDKIHQAVHAEFGDTACSVSGGGAGDNGALVSSYIGHGVGMQLPQAAALRQGADPPPASAALAAAARVAWHGVASGGGGVCAPDGAR
jgi:hypothetical protein